MTKDNLERLAFPQLTEEQLSALAKFTTLENYHAGQTLFSAGDSGFKLFVIKKGEVEIVENTTGKQRRVIVHQEREFTGGPTIPEIKELFPDHKIHDRSPINLWNDPECRQAVEATNRKKLIMAAITTDVCLAFPALAAIQAGYDVYAVIDASGTWSSQAELATMMRLTQAGVIMTNWIAVAAELKHDENRKTTPGMNQAFGQHMGLYDFLGDIAAAKG